MKAFSISQMDKFLIILFPLELAVQIDNRNLLSFQRLLTSCCIRTKKKEQSNNFVQIKDFFGFHAMATIMMISFFFGCSCGYILFSLIFPLFSSFNLI